MKLSVTERILALQILPKEGDFVTLNVMRKAQEMLSFTEAEIAKYKFKNIPTEDGGQRTQWDSSIEQVIDLRLGNKAISIIGEALEKLDKEKKLEMNQISLYEKFVEKQK